VGWKEIQEGADGRRWKYAGVILHMFANEASRSMPCLSDPGLRDCVHNIVHTGIGDVTCHIPYLCCTLLACEVGLADTEGSHSSCTRV
jgi:hypothetical protein